MTYNSLNARTAQTFISHRVAGIQCRLSRFFRDMLFAAQVAAYAEHQFPAPLILGLWMRFTGAWTLAQIVARFRPSQWL